MAHTADVVVIGAGIVGSAIAQRAASKRLSVAVLERGLPGRQGSGTTAGNVHIQTIHTRRPGQQVPVDVRRLLPLQRAARLLWDDWEDEIGPVGFNRSGGFMVAENAEQAADLHRKFEWEQAAGVPSEVLDGDAARSALPLLGPAVTAATWCGWDGFADPAAVTPALIAAAVDRGASLHSRKPVHGLVRSMGGWVVRAGDETWHTPFVVNAAGPWMAGICALAGADLEVTPLSIQMHLLADGPERLPFVIAHVGEGMSVKQVASGQIMVGGGWPAGSFTDSGDAQIDPASVEGNMAQVRRILPAIGARRLERVWTGPLAANADEMPVIGEVPGAPGLLVAGGTYSFTFAPLWGSIITGALTGEESPVDVSDLGPSRLIGPAHQRRSAT